MWLKVTIMWNLFNCDLSNLSTTVMACKAKCAMKCLSRLPDKVFRNILQVSGHRTHTTVGILDFRLNLTIASWTRSTADLQDLIALSWPFEIQDISQHKKWAVASGLRCLSSCRAPQRHLISQCTTTVFNTFSVPAGRSQAPSTNSLILAQVPLLLVGSTLCRRIRTLGDADQQP